MSIFILFQFAQFIIPYPLPLDMAHSHAAYIAPLSEGAGLVKHDRIHAPRLFYRRGALEQNAQLRAASGRGHERRGSSKP